MYDSGIEKSRFEKFDESYTKGGFKLLAVRPLKGCDKKFLKNLKEGEIYKFYQDYDFIIESDGENKSTRELNYKQYKKSEIVDVIIPSGEIDLYSEGEIKINVSAIVGKNGSGKSSLIELFLLSISKLKEIINFKTSKSDISENIFLEIYVGVDDSVFQIKITKKGVEVFNLSDKNSSKKVNFENHMFFSNLINYSLYSFLEDSTLSNFFHRNDRYETPVFISPKRENSTINIKQEISQSENNLLYHLLYSELQGINNLGFSFKSLDLYIYDEIQYEIGENIHFKRKNVDSINSEMQKIIDTNTDLFFSIYDCNFGKCDININQLREYLRSYIAFLDNQKMTLKAIIGYLLLYINVKLTKIVERKESNYEQENLIWWIPKIDDPSHESFKFFQTVFFIESIEEFEDKIIIKNSKFYLSISDFRSFVLRSLTNEKFRKLSVFQKLPLAGFKIHLLENSIDVLRRSSGQLQQMNIISSITSTLIFLNSRTDEYMVVNNIEDNWIRNYKNVIVFLDEIELNLHPELQRTLLFEIVESLRSLKINTLSIQLVFLTHSPFILSDIPSQNILRLSNDNGISEPQPLKDKTFAANIHDLLANDFFLKYGFMGEFARKKIEGIIKHLNPLYLLSNADEIEKMKNIIKLIGEPIVKSRLSQLFNTQYPAFADDNDNIEEQIRKQQDLLRQLEDKRKK